MNPGHSTTDEHGFTQIIATDRKLDKYADAQTPCLLFCPFFISVYPCPSVVPSGPDSGEEDAGRHGDVEGFAAAQSGDGDDLIRAVA